MVAFIAISAALVTAGLIAWAGEWIALCDAERDGLPPSFLTYGDES